MQKTCPHANACLTCPVFLTGPEFLPRAPRTPRPHPDPDPAAEAGGQARLAEMNRQVLTNLDRMIDGVQTTRCTKRSRRGPDAI